jgi:hypothetical protein
MFDTAPFEGIASKLSNKQYDCSFTENESGGLCFLLTPKGGQIYPLLESIIGSFIPKCRKLLSSLGYTLESKPNLTEEFVSLDLKTSPFHGALANLSEGYATPEAYIRQSVELLTSDGLDAEGLRNVLAMLEAVKSHGLPAAKSVTEEEVPL